MVSAMGSVAAAAVALAEVTVLAVAIISAETVLPVAQAIVAQTLEVVQEVKGVALRTTLISEGEER